MMQIHEITTLILKMRNEVPAERSLLAGISGIDASGKGFIATRVNDELRRRSVRSALINVDGWQNLPNVRFCRDEPGKHFYNHALRLDEMFERLILPLKQCRSIRLNADLATETAPNYHQFEHGFDDIDIIVLEGIFIFKIVKGNAGFNCQTSLGIRFNMSYRIHLL